MVQAELRLFSAWWYDTVVRQISVAWNRPI